ncbi:hypothetical protein MRX96_018126 [Rhipicephalus microplus]
MRSVRPCEGELQLARQLHQMWPDPPGRELQTDPAPVCQLRGPSLWRHPGVPPVAGAAEGCHNHGIFPNHPLEARSGSGGAGGDSGGADLCKRGEGPPCAAPLQPDPSRRLANLAASHSRDCSPPALLPLWPCQRPLLFLRPRLLQLPLSQPSLQLLSLEAGLLCPWLLRPRLLRQ